ncbi:hypothetical protein [Aeromonas media]|uniref:hypothetical protein n=1 Tax=Aeromonas media TaxID=651 RepID=UPI003D24071B
MFLKKDVVDFVVGVQMDIVSLDNTMKKQFIPEIDLEDPDMKSILTYVRDIKESITDVQAVIGVLMAKVSQCKGATLDNVDDEIQIVEEFSKMIQNVKINLEPLYI